LQLQKENKAEQGQPNKTPQSLYKSERKKGSMDKTPKGGNKENPILQKMEG